MVKRGQISGGVITTYRTGAGDGVNPPGSGDATNFIIVRVGYVERPGAIQKETAG